MYNINIDFLHIILRIFYCFMFGCLLFLVMLLFLCVFLVFCKYLICVLLLLITAVHHHVILFFHFHINIDKGADCLQNNNNVYANDLWLAFASVLFLKVWFNKTGIIKLRLLYFYLFICYFLCTNKSKLLIIMRLFELVVDMNFSHLTTSILLRIFKH